MSHPYWNDWYFGWGWFLWFGILFLMFSSLGNWGYSYRAHRRVGELAGKDAIDILNERYARGEISREELGRHESADLKRIKLDSPKAAAGPASLGPCRAACHLSTTRLSMPS